MKIVNILGGLGNQMFQYAFALKLKILFPKEEVKIYTKAFNGYSLHNGYELDKVFNIILPQASTWEVTKQYWPIKNYTIYRLCRHYFPKRKAAKDSFPNPITLNDLTKCSFFDGYFQKAEHYEDISDQIITHLTFPKIEDSKNLQAVQFINRGETSSLHVRRGDYVGDPMFSGICDIQYYKKALEKLKTNTHTRQLLIFSNDITWTKENLYQELQDFDVLYVDWNLGEQSFRDMQLMTLCHNNIIANSSFSWWGAFLNTHPNKLVIAPNKWINSDVDICIQPSSWIKITD